MLKKCPRCGKILPSSEFSTNTRHCRICRRDYDWQYRYGISPEQYLQMYNQQDGKCLICGKEPDKGKYLSVDHDKETGEVRGLLCSKCNSGIGLFKENINAMARAIRYLLGNIS